MLCIQKIQKFTFHYDRKFFGTLLQKEASHSWKFLISYVPGAKKIEDQSLKRVNHNFSGIGGPGGFFLKTFSIYSRYPCSKILNAQLLSVNFFFIILEISIVVLIYAIKIHILSSIVSQNREISFLSP